MNVACPYCEYVFRAYIEEGHLLLDYGDLKRVHSPLCKCNKKPLITQGK
jgi:hypothetical protein